MVKSMLVEKDGKVMSCRRVYGTYAIIDVEIADYKNGHKVGSHIETHKLDPAYDLEDAQKFLYAHLRRRMRELGYDEEGQTRLWTPIVGSERYETALQEETFRPAIICNGHFGKAIHKTAGNREDWY